MKGQRFLFFEGCSFVGIYRLCLCRPSHVALPVAVHTGGDFFPGWEGNWIARLNEPCGSLRKGCHLVLYCVRLLWFSSVRLILPFFIFLQTGLQLWFRKVHSILLYFLSQFFRVSLVQAVVCNCISQLEVHVADSSNCEYWVVFLDGFPLKKNTWGQSVSSEENGCSWNCSLISWSFKE